jgi:hypothetical protein
MLHIVTPWFRYELLPRVYETLPPHNDVLWHVVKTSRRPTPPHPFLSRDPRIRLHDIDCDDADIVAKRNAAFDHVTDGYFYLLDDDTTCLESVYRTYHRLAAEGFEGMAIGHTTLQRAQWPSLDPAVNHFDAGAVLCHHGVLRHIRWERHPTVARDIWFWTRAFAHLGPARTRVLDETLSIYNHLGPKMRVRKRVLGVPLHWDIESAWLARCYILAAAMKRRLHAGIRPQ